MIINTQTNPVETANNPDKISKALAKGLAKLHTDPQGLKATENQDKLSVTDKLRRDSTGYGVSMMKLQNSASMLHTADGYLNTMATSLEQMFELSQLVKDTSKSPDDKLAYESKFEGLKDKLRNIVGNAGETSKLDPKWGISGDKPSATFNDTILFGPDSSAKALLDETHAEGGKSLDLNLQKPDGPIAALLWDESYDSSKPSTRIADEGTPEKVEAAVAYISSARTTVKSLEDTVNQSQSQLEILRANLDSANSRIRDVDVAVEATEMVKKQLQQDSGDPIAAQANTIPEHVLKLLK